MSTAATAAAAPASASANHPADSQTSSTASPRRLQMAESDSVPKRAQSTSVRHSAPPSSAVHRSFSQSYQNNRPPSSSRQATMMSAMQKETEDTDHAPSSSRRSSSLDRRSADRGSRTADSNRHPHRPSSRSRPPSYSAEPPHSAATTQQPSSTATENGTRAAPPSSGSGAPKRRTTISAQTGQWALGKTIGQGSMGKVKLARNLETGEVVAVKIVPRQSQEDHRSTQDRERADHSKDVRTAREVAIMTLVHHPYICSMRDVVRTNYHWYMLLEYVNGGQMLDYIISHGRLKEKQARRFARQIASALDYSHRNSIVHRDLKIENILISKSGDIKIIDYGLSNLFAPRNLLKTFCGSLYFAAPELLQAKAYTGPEIDVWSFGIVLYVLVCGKVPFDDQSMPQLHAKIKKGVFEYPPWLTTECRHIISQMLVLDPSQRGTLIEIMNHPWMNKGYNGPPENYVPHREPIQLPLDAAIIEKMTGFDFGTPEHITQQLEAIIQSEEYQRLVRVAARRQQPQGGETERKRSSVFDFYQRRKSASSKDTLTAPSAEVISFGEDPVNAFSPLLSIYYLVREKMDREKAESNPGALKLPTSPGQTAFNLPDLTAPEAAHTNSTPFEMRGEAPTGGRARPRARTHGEDDLTESMKQEERDRVPATTKGPSSDMNSAKRESTTIGLLRRLSTRRGRTHERQNEPEKSTVPTTPAVAVSNPDGSPATRKSLNVRKTRGIETPPSAIVNNHPELLSPTTAAEEISRKSKTLGRSTSVNSADLQRRWSRRGGRGEAESSRRAEQTLSQKSSANDMRNGTEGDEQTHRAHASRARSTGHPHRESIQGYRRGYGIEGEVPEETDQELAEEHARSGLKATPSTETMKPIYLKGLFSVSTTSSKPLAKIRADIIRVLRQLGVEYSEMKGGFSCRHVPSIDLNKVVDNPPTTPGAELRQPDLVQQQQQQQQQHKRRISFARLRTNDSHRDEALADQPARAAAPTTPKTPVRRGMADSSVDNSDASDEEAARRRKSPPRVAGETSTHVQSDLGKSMILKFEILVVKVPFLSLHGLQFKKVDGGTWQYKTMADAILKELRL